MVFRGRRSNVRGPRSALTAFLQEKGIDANEIRRAANRRAAQAAAQAAAGAEDAQAPDNADDNDVEEDDGDEVAESSAAASRRPVRRRSHLKKGTYNEDEDEVMADANESDYQEDEPEQKSTTKSGKAKAQAETIENSRKRRRSTTTLTVNFSAVDIDIDEDDIAVPSSSKKKEKKPTKAQLKKLKKAEAKKARKAGDDISDDDDGDFEPNRAVPLPGQIALCAECNCRFTVTPYSKSGPDGEGLLCHPCGKASAPAETAARKKKQVTRTIKKTNARALLDGDNGGIKTLQELCIQLVAKHIDDVEALGNIGTYNMDKICQIISKNRSLNDHTMKLFLEPGSTTLNLYDCYKINSDNLRLIAAFIPTLRRLHLKFCGRMNDSCLDYYGTQLKHLESLDLYGAFNVTEPCYIRFFETVGPRLKEFGVSDNSRFRLAALEALVDNCPDLEVLRLRTLTHIDDQCIRLLTGLPNLRVLEISEPSMDITDQPIIDILNTCGSALRELNLDGCSQLTDAVLDAIHESCGKLEILSLAECELVTNEALSKLFIGWDVNFGLRHLNLTRCNQLDSSGLIRVIDHSGNTLEKLSVNSCKEIGKDGWGFLSHFQLKSLEEVDVSMIRSVNDEVVEKFLEVAPALRVVRAWGCHKLTEAVQLREDLHLVGREADILS
ncbi:hypothetical protein ABW21_db0205786 [Orbilia brochopaga]|nr:hypothetical protein ABW21_db0205786 [Drechslerella brochopaga]